MARRWVASALHDAKGRFRKLRRHKDMKALLAALNSHAEKLRAPECATFKPPRNITKSESPSDCGSTGSGTTPVIDAQGIFQDAWGVAAAGTSDPSESVHETTQFPSRHLVAVCRSAAGSERGSPFSFVKPSERHDDPRGVLRQPVPTRLGVVELPLDRAKRVCPLSSSSSGPRPAGCRRSPAVRRVAGLLQRSAAAPGYGRALAAAR